MIKINLRVHENAKLRLLGPGYPDATDFITRLIMPAVCFIFPSLRADTRPWAIHVELGA